MGAYVNPKDISKEKWLNKNGTEIESINSINYNKLDSNILPVVLVDNGAFTAAAIAFCQSAWERFIDPTDNRPKKVFLVDINKLHTVSKELQQYMAVINNV